MPSIIFTQLERNLSSNWSTTLQYSNLFLSFVIFLCQKTFIYLASHIFIDGFHIYTLDIWHSSHLLTRDDQLCSGGIRPSPVVQLHDTIWEMPNFNELTECVFMMSLFSNFSSLSKISLDDFVRRKGETLGEKNLSLK